MHNDPIVRVLLHLLHLLLRHLLLLHSYLISPHHIPLIIHWYAISSLHWSHIVGDLIAVGLRPRSVIVGTGSHYTLHFLRGH